MHYHNVLLWINPTRRQEQTVGFGVTIMRSLMSVVYNENIWRLTHTFAHAPEPYSHWHQGVNTVVAIN